MIFFREAGFMLELLVTAAVVSAHMTKRSKVLARALTSLLVATAIAWSWSVFLTPTIVWAVIARSLVFYVLCYAALYVCVELTAKQALFVTAGTVALQHACYSCAQIVQIGFPVLNAEGIASIFYGQWFVYPLLFCAFLTCGYFLFSRGMQGRLPEHVANSFIFVAVGIMLCVTVFSTLFDEFIAHTRIANNAYFMFVLTRLVTCLFLLILLREITERETAQRDNEFLSQLLNQQRQKFESDEETINLINIKTHDLKKQLTVLEGRVTQEEIDNLKDLVNIYDSSLRTGNETLDVLLAHKSLICEQRGILFDRMIDGSHLSFMKPADIYSLFGNAIDNAMEATVQIANEQQRYIRMKVQEVRDMIIIHIENSCARMPRFVRGLPQTSKKDKRYHGFGVKSMQLVTQHYGGVMDMSVRDNVFSLNIMIPLR